MSHLLLDDNTVEIQKENLGILKFSAENLMTLINNVLDFTKIETGNIELKRRMSICTNWFKACRIPCSLM